MPDRVTMIDIAKAAGVSKSTVSLVLQGSPLVKAETRARVNAAIDKLGYVYNRGAANLRQSRSNMVGMVINDLTNPFFAEMAVGIESVLQGSGYIPIMSNTAENPIRQIEVIRLMREQGVAGLIVSPARRTQAETFEGLTDSGIPAVLAMRRVAGVSLATVTPDNTLGGTLATEHLLSLGHRRIAMLGGFDDISVSREREEGYRRALDAAGVAFDPALVVHGDSNRGGGARALADVMRIASTPTAAVCFNDAVALGACLALQRRGIEPGAGFAIVGFDDVEEASLAVPALTTVAVDPKGLGERAAHRLVRAIETGQPIVQDYVGAISLVVRESCGARRSETRTAHAIERTA